MPTPENIIKPAPLNIPNTSHVHCIYLITSVQQKYHVTGKNQMRKTSRHAEASARLQHHFLLQQEDQALAQVLRLHRGPVPQRVPTQLLSQTTASATTSRCGARPRALQQPRCRAPRCMRLVHSGIQKRLLQHSLLRSRPTILGDCLRPTTRIISNKNY
jgi:hypothetical protein